MAVAARRARTAAVPARVGGHAPAEAAVGRDPLARRRAVSLVGRGDRDAGGGEEAHAVEAAVIEPHLTEALEIGAGGEEPGVARDTTKERGHLVVHFSRQGAAAARHHP